MVGASKILTVSYGTFSCTLEGFEDSFGTMKAIAEYFRDLAAHDRYFGAEPPTPDADMLARIAEREISRRVEARSDESGITLRASEALAAPEPAAAPAPEQATRPAGPDADKDRAEKTAAHDAKSDRAKSDRAEPDLAQSDLAEPDAPGSELPAPEAPEIDTPHADSPEADITGADITGADTTEADLPQPAAPKAAPDGPDTPLNADWDDTTEEDLGDLAEDEIDTETFEDAPAAEATAEPAPVRTVAPAHPDPDSVAAKLQRIRAVVGRAEDPSDYSEDLAEAAAPETPQEVADTLADLAGLQGDDFETAPAQEHAQDSRQDQSGDDDGDDDILSSILARSGGAGDPAETAAEEVSDTEADPQDTAEDFETSLAKALSADAETPETETPRAETPEATETEATETEATETEATESGGYDTEIGAAEAEPQTAPRPRVTRMKRSEFEAAMASGAIEPIDADAPDATTPQDEIADLAALDGAEEFDDFDDDIDSGLSAEEEAALLEELAAVDDPADDDDDDDDDDDEPLSAIGAEGEDDDDLDDEARPSRAELLRTRPDEDEQAMSRLMSEADNQMQEPEGNRRREAIAHLKAAVAATEAARRMGETPGDADEGEVAYRDDLDRVVRPRRAARQVEARTERPRPAPLKLVAAQRVDSSKASETPAAPARPVAPVRPRRVTAEPEAPARPAAATAPAGASGGFAEFCDKMGAYDLADQLEAAAAYTAYVEGVEDFSRPQIMRKVRDMSPEEFSREDGLRSFGTLLREGRIQKVRNGRFQVAENTRFHPARRTG